MCQVNLSLITMSKYAINQYISFEGYKINEKFKNNVPLNKAEKQMVKNLDSVLSRLKDCTETVVRVLELQSDKYILYWRKDNG